MLEWGPLGDVDMLRELLIIVLISASILGCARSGVGIGPNSAQIRSSIPLN
jgi:hypothetical protein